MPINLNHCSTQAEKEARKSLRPEDMFKGETDKYSAFDEEGAFGDVSMHVCACLMEDDGTLAHCFLSRLIVMERTTNSFFNSVL